MSITRLKCCCKVVAVFVLLLTNNLIAQDVISTFGGTGIHNYSGDGGQAINAQINRPRGIAIDASGDIYFSTQSNRVRKIDVSTGIITTFAGNATLVIADGGPATSSSLSNPKGLCFDATYSNLYIADAAHNRIRKVNMNTSIITTVAGTGDRGYSGNNGAATSAELNAPEGVYVDDSGNIFIADTQNHMVRKVASGTGVITLIAGTSPIGAGPIYHSGNTGDNGIAYDCTLDEPSGLVGDNSNLYIADSQNSRIRKVDITDPNGLITAITSVSGTIEQLFLDGTNVIYYSENIRSGIFGGDYIKKYVISTTTTTTIAGVGTAGFSGDTADATLAEMDSPNGIVRNAAGEFFISDTGNSRIRMVGPPDVTDPTTSSFAPLDNATGVSVSNNLTLTFDEDIQLTGVAALKNFDTNAVIPSASTASGAVLTISPTASLSSETSYYIEIASGVIQDLSANDYTGFTGNATWNFTTADIAAPVASSFSPIDNSTDVSISSNLIITFDENIVLSGAAELKKVSDNSTITTTSKISGNILTINPSSDLSYGTAYYVELSSGVVQDFSGNNYAGFTGNSFWNITTEIADVIAPTVSTYSPVNKASDVLIDANLVLTFDENVQSTGGGMINIKFIDGDAVKQGFSLPSGNVTFSGNTVTINSPIDLDNETDYYVEISNDAIEDLAGNNFAGISGPTLWSLTTESALDIIAPLATTYSPLDNAIDVDAAGDFVITFNENIQNTGSGGIIIKKGNGTNLEVIALPNAKAVFSGATITINPTLDLLYESDYYFYISNDAVEDLAGNNFTGMTAIDTWNFSTGAAPDVTAPSVSSLSPLDHASDVGIDDNLVLTFDEDIQSTGTGAIFIRNSNHSILQAFALPNFLVAFSGNTITINPNTNFAYDSDYYVTVSNVAVEDLVGNNFAGISIATDWVFTTGPAPDVTAPSISVLNPMDNAVDIATNLWTFGVSFDENIQEGSGTINLRESSSDAIIANAVIGSSRVLVSGTLLGIDFNADGGLGDFEMDNSTEYYIEIPSGTVEDLAGNAFTGIAKPDFSFTTAAFVDILAPVVTTLSPTDGSTGAHILTNLSITFDEAVQKGSGNFLIYDDNDALLQNININNSAITVSGMSITINPTSALVYGKSYYVSITSGAIEDLSGNDFVMVKGDWAFSPAATDIHEPTLLSFNPTHESIDRDLLNNNLFMTFNESMYAGAGNVYVKRADTDAIAITKAASSLFNIGNITPYLSGGGNVLEYGTEYYVEVEATALTDAEGNAFAGIAKGEWHFSTISDPNVITWNGSAWSNGSGPIVSNDVEIDGAYNTATHGNITANNITVKVSQTVEVGDGNFIKVNGDLLHHGGGFIVASGGSLVTMGNVTGANFTFKRTTTFDQNTGRYSTLGAPVSGAGFSSLGSNATIYGYDETESYNIGGNEGLDRFKTPAQLSQTTLQAGQGYFSAKTGDNNGLISFSGTPNHNTQSLTLTLTDHPVEENDFEGFNLVANPYPCAIDLVGFLTENSNDIEGAIYIWDDFNSGNGRGGNSDYMVANAAGFVDSRSTTSKWNGIHAMQGFFVQANAAGDLQLDFTNAMKITGNNADAGFYRAANEQASFKLSLSNLDGHYAETLIAMKDEATWETDQFDARLFNQSGTKIYSQISGKPFAIQGIPVQDQAVIPIGTQTDPMATFTISLKEISNIEGNIVLTDHFLNKSFDLTTGSGYTFNTLSGVNKDRFSIAVQSTITSIDELTEDWIVYQNANGGITLRSNIAKTVKSLELINISGQRHQVNVGQVNANEWASVQLNKEGIFILRILSKNTEQITRVILK